MMAYKKAELEGSLTDRVSYAYVQEKQAEVLDTFQKQFEDARIRVPRKLQKRLKKAQKAYQKKGGESFDKAFDDCFETYISFCRERVDDIGNVITSVDGLFESYKQSIEDSYQKIRDIRARRSRIRSVLDVDRYMKEGGYESLEGLAREAENGRDVSGDYSNAIKDAIKRYMSHYHADEGQGEDRIEVPLGRERWVDLSVEMDELRLDARDAIIEIRCCLKAREFGQECQELNHTAYAERKRYLEEMEGVWEKLRLYR